MLHPKLIRPKSIVVVGGSDRLDHLGGSVIKNLLDSGYQGDIRVINPKRKFVQGLKSYPDLTEISEVDLAIMAIKASDIPPAVKILTQQKKCRAFLVFSAGFSELNEEGKRLEKEMCQYIDQVGGTLLGPNHIGMINEHYAGIFTRPLPKLDPKGVTFISASGATAVFTLEAATRIGLSFSSIYTVGNSAQTGLEDILEYLDFHFDKDKSSKVIMLYIEGIKNPEKFLRHCVALKNKGCSITALKAGVTAKGNQAASSHTGAMASSKVFSEALFDKAGIIACKSRYELVHQAAVLQISQKPLLNIGIITHAGGPAVILTDVLCENGLEVPTLNELHQKKLCEVLYPGATAQNPIDLLATGNAEQLHEVIEYCNQKLDQLQALVLIFGSPGLTEVGDIHQVIDYWMQKSEKPIFAIMPSVVNIANEIQSFREKGNLVFYDEKMLGIALSRLNMPKLFEQQSDEFENLQQVKSFLQSCKNGYMEPDQIDSLFKLIDLPIVDQWVFSERNELFRAAEKLPYPLVQKVVGVLHKSDQKGVIVNVNSAAELIDNFDRLMKIPEARAVLIQPMLKGVELFIGAKRENSFPPLILCGQGGIFVEIYKDIEFGLAPLSFEEAVEMIHRLKIYPLLKGSRGEKGISIEYYARLIEKISLLVESCPEIIELDLNPLIANSESISLVDARIRLEKTNTPHP